MSQPPQGPPAGQGNPAMPPAGSYPFQQQQHTVQMIATPSGQAALMPNQYSMGVAAAQMMQPHYHAQPMQMAHQQHLQMYSFQPGMSAPMMHHVPMGQQQMAPSGQVAAPNGAVPSVMNQVMQGQQQQQQQQQPMISSGMVHSGMMQPQGSAPSQQQPSSAAPTPSPAPSTSTAAAAATATGVSLETPATTSAQPSTEAQPPSVSAPPATTTAKEDAEPVAASTGRAPEGGGDGAGAQVEGQIKVEDVKAEGKSGGSKPSTGGSKPKPSGSKSKPKDKKPPIPPEEAARILPKSSLNKLLASVARAGEKMDEDLQDALVSEAEGFLEGAIVAGCTLARRRKADTLEPRDVALHLERQFHLPIPGYSGGDQVRPYKRPAACEIHAKRHAAVRKSRVNDALQLEKQQEKLREQQEQEQREQAAAAATGILLPNGPGAVTVAPNDEAKK